MVQAIVDPEDVRKFATQLRQYSSDLRSGLGRMNGQLKSLGGTWRDMEYQRFENEFTNTAQTLRRFADSSGEYANFLSRKAAKAEEYLHQR